MIYCNHDYTEKSDVWSYGVTLWEIFTYGEIPYNELDNCEVKPAVLKGKRLQIRQEFPESVRSIMKLCWLEPCERPFFKDIVTHLTHVQQDKKMNDVCPICKSVFEDEGTPLILPIPSPAQTSSPNPIDTRDLKEKLIPIVKGFGIFIAIITIITLITLIVIANVASIGNH